MFNASIRLTAKAVILAGIIVALSLTQMVSTTLYPFVGLLLGLMTVTAWKRHEYLSFQLGLISLIGTLPWLSRFCMWPIPLLLSIFLIGIIYYLLKYQSFSLHWFKFGNFNTRTISLGCISIIVSSLALIIWFIVMKPDLSDLKRNVPKLPIPYLALGGVVFAITNAFAEEFLFRGIMFRALQRSLKSPSSIILIQAISFGCLHMNGFPRGGIGVGLATIYGVMMGIIRQLSQGMIAPWLFHVFVDITIASILVIYVF